MIDDPITQPERRAATRKRFDAPVVTSEPVDRSPVPEPPPLEPSEITYTRRPDNSLDVVQFVTATGDPDALPVCCVCDGFGEYEDELGPRGCHLCNSRLIRIRTSDGQLVDVDWGDTVINDGAGRLSVRRGVQE
jgi:hypothetical protein